jgi:hypothetical protein
MKKYKDIYSVVVFAIVVHTALTASLVNMFITLSYVKKNDATGTEKPFLYGGPIDLGVVVDAEDSTSADGDDIISDYVTSNFIDMEVSLENYSAPTTSADAHGNNKANKPKTVRYMMW